MMKSDGINSKKLGAAVREKREKKGLSQKKLGETFDLSSGSIWWLEAGNIEKVSEDNARKILSFLGIELSEFMREEEKASEPDVAIKSAGAISEVVKKSRRQSDSEKRKVPCTVSGKITGEVYEKVRQYANNKGLSINEVVRRAIEKFFADPEAAEKVPAGAEIAPHPPSEPLAKEQEKIEEMGEEKKTEMLYEDEEERECLDELMRDDEEEGRASVEEIKMLLKGGHGYEEIGELMGLTAEKVRQALLGKHREQKEKKRKEFVDRELKKLDAMQNALWDKAIKGSTTSVELVLKIMGLRSQLMGTDRRGG